MTETLEEDLGLKKLSEFLEMTALSYENLQKVDKLRFELDRKIEGGTGDKNLLALNKIIKSRNEKASV